MKQFLVLICLPFGILATLSGIRAASFEGQLVAGDEELSSGEYQDKKTFNGTKGQTVEIDLRSSEFDPYLILRLPDGTSLGNDDYEGDTGRSFIKHTLSEDGEFVAVATSYRPGETGAYVLNISTGGSGLADATRRIERGQLKEGDDQLTSGEFRHTYTFAGVSGQEVLIDLHSADFDPYLVLRLPDGDTLDNDDFNGDAQRSQIAHTLVKDGEYRIVVTSYKAGETGAYTLEYPQSAATASSGVRTEQGRLETGDSTLSSGEFKDTFTFEGVAGDRVLIDLRSTAFDPYLILKLPDGEQTDNDDHEGSNAWSQISLTLEQSGTYSVIATTYLAGATGDYELVITRRPRDSDTEEVNILETGNLATGDSTLNSGEFTDDFRYALTPGERLVVNLRSTEFDPYLLIRTPSGETVDNDDHEGATTHSQIDLPVTEAGEYIVYVTSYKAGETGSYELAVEVAEEQSQPTPSNDVEAIALGETKRGTLGAGDLELDNGEWADVFVIDGAVGQTLSFDLRTDDFDPYLVIQTPSDQSLQNDDFDGDTNRSRIDLPITEAGRYRVFVTSYAANEVGDYQLSVTTGRSIEQPAPSGEIYGVFVGVSDYGGRSSLLNYTDEDARRIQRALISSARMPASHGTLLLNSEATRDAFETAVRRAGAQATSADTLVIFFSGHGDRYARPNGPDRSDPDGFDESLEFYDREMIDDDLAALLDSVNAGTVLVIVDACFSGGLAKDIISAPGRMGCFSSEEDVTSAVAAKFRAGGYLSLFFAESLTEPYADADVDGFLTALELSHYIDGRYNAHVKSADPGWVSTANNLGYQKFVVDRGSIRPLQNLFRR